MLPIDKQILCTVSAVILLSILFILEACGTRETSCDPVDGVYESTYTQEHFTGPCDEFGQDPHFTQTFAKGKPITDTQDCTITRDDLTRDQCNVRFEWECESMLDDGTPFTFQFTEILSQHEGGRVLEGPRSIVVSLSGGTCESSGHVRYEALHSERPGSK